MLILFIPYDKGFPYKQHTRSNLRYCCSLWSLCCMSISHCVSFYFIIFSVFLSLFASEFWCAMENKLLDCSVQSWNQAFTQRTISAFIMDSLYLACSTLGPVCVEFDALVAAVFKAENHFQKGWMVFYLSMCVWCIFFGFIWPVHTKFYWQSWNIKLPTRR